MKILFATNMCGFWGGVEQMVVTYARGLSRRGHEVYLAYGMEGRDKDVFSEPFLKTFQCSEFGVGDVSSGVPFNEILAQVHPEVAFFHKVTHLPTDFEYNTEVRKVYMVHDHDLWCPTRRGNFRLSRKVCHHCFGWRCYLDLAFVDRAKNSVFPAKIVSVRKRVEHQRRHHKFDCVLPVCTYLHEQLTKNGFPPEKTHVCFPILDCDDYAAEPVPEAPNILFIGTLIRPKGVDFLLRALHTLKTPFKLDIVGQGKSENALKELCHKLGLDDRVNFVGWVDHNDVSEYYKKAKVIALPSCWPECFALVGQESMRHGRPVVAFNVGGNSDWLEHEHTGFIVPEQDVDAYAHALERLLTDTTLARQLGKNASDRVQERFPFEKSLSMVESYLSGESGIKSSSEISGNEL